MIRKCTCHNYYMDTHYGTGMRVMNLMKDGKAARCTACGMVHILPTKERTTEKEMPPAKEEATEKRPQAKRRKKGE